MTTIYLTENCDLYTKAKTLSLRHISHPIEILKTENGKPYFEGNPLFLSLSDSGNLGVIALSSSPIGVDAELFCGKKYQAILSHFAEAEQLEIKTEKDFLTHWTAREAYVKLYGKTLAENFRHLTFVGGKMYFDETLLQETFTFHYFEKGVICLCGGDGNLTIENL
jgi:phosphopantetheinyl transferase